MNKENLHELIQRYENNYEMINNSKHDEIFKWAAVRCFRDVWFSEEAASMPFANKFIAATKESSVLINNHVVSPTSGIVKMAEERPEQVEKLFQEVLFADYETIEELQDHMDYFLGAIEEIRQDLFPSYYRYKQDRHAASCYLAFFAPEKHFIYRYSEAEEFANCIEFGKNLGSGTDFSLKNYYELAEIVVEALREHPTLMAKYDSRIKGNDHYYYDKSLHLMAFDLMYCNRNYNFYKGLHHLKKKEAIKLQNETEQREKEKAELQQKITELEDKIHALDVQMDLFEEISLIGVEVTQKKYGKGIIIAQDVNKITVQFAEDTIKKFVLNNQAPGRPRFEDDDEVVDAFTEYGKLKKQKEELEKELNKLV